MVSMLLAPGVGWGQGWERVYDFDPTFEDFNQVIQTQDSCFVAEAYANQKINLFKISQSGKMQWRRTIENEWSGTIKLHELLNGNLVGVAWGHRYGQVTLKDTFKTWVNVFSSTGVLLSSKEINFAGYKGVLSRDVLVEDGGFLIAGSVFKDSALSEIRKPILYRVSFDGQVIWKKIFNYFPSSGFEELTLVEKAMDNGYFLMHAYNPGSHPFLQRLVKVDSVGNYEYAVPIGAWSYTSDIVLAQQDSSLLIRLQWVAVQKRSAKDGALLASWKPESSFDISEIALSSTHEVLVIGDQEIEDKSDIKLIKLNLNLQPIWEKTYVRQRDFSDNVIELYDKGFLLSARTVNPFFESDLYLIRTDSLGNSITNLIAGQVQWDQDKDCIEQPADPGLKNWIVTATSPTDTFYRSTAPDGSYALRVDTGHYTVRVRPLNSLWDADCVVLDTVLTQMFDTIQHNFPVRATVDCPGMEVSTVVARLRPCLPANLQVWYCNNGTIAAEEALIQVVLNEHMTYDSASLAPTLVSGDTLWFDLDTVQTFECGNFYIRVLVDCDTMLLGQTLCYTAHAYPDTTCLSPAEWSGAQVVTTGYCEGDSVRLVLRNIGSAATAQGLEYIIVEDNVIMLQVPFWLPPGDSIVLKVKANGSTWRIIAQQEPGFPNGFFTTVVLEGCHEGGNFSTGFVNQFPSGDGAPWLDEECRTVTGSYDPNDKSAVPEGYGEQHFVAANTDLEYLIRFQNTGTDTAFRVVIRDQISPYLDPASVRPGAASHPYTWSLGGTGELVFTFDPIALPDSNTNLAASQGFVQFRIAQRANLPQNTRFENTAAIYFDFNAPVVTNTVFHTIQPLFKPTSSVESPVFAAGERLKIWPNPASEVAYISFKDKVLSPRKLSLYDLSGRLAAVTFSSENTVAVQRGKLPAGMYLVKIEAAGERTQVGAVVFR